MWGIKDSITIRLLFKQSGTSCLNISKVHSKNVFEQIYYYFLTRKHNLRERPM